MPVYEYRCNSCGETFEILRSFKDEETEVKCPKCGAGDVSRVYSPCGGGASKDSCPPIPMTWG